MSASSPTASGRPTFRMEESFDADGALRLVLSGELDMAVVDKLSSRLQELRKGRYVVRLDLAKLEFIDSTGLRELIVAASDSGQDGWRLEIGSEMTETVRRVIDLVGVRSLFWPDTG